MVKKARCINKKVTYSRRDFTHMSNSIIHNIYVILFLLVLFVQSRSMEKPPATLAKNQNGIEGQPLSKKQRQQLFKKMPDLDKSIYRDHAPEYDDKSSFELTPLCKADRKVIEAARTCPVVLPLETKREATLSEKRKLAKIHHFFDKQIRKTRTGHYDSYEELSKIVGNHRSYYHLMIKDPNYKQFLTDRINAQDAYTIFNLAAVLTNASRPSKSKKIPLCPILAQKALDLLYHVQKMPHNDAVLKKDIDIFIGRIVQGYPKLYDYFQQLHGVKSVFPKPLAWHEECMKLQEYLEKSASKKHQERAISIPPAVTSDQEPSKNDAALMPTASSRKVSVDLNQILTPQVKDTVISPEAVCSVQEVDASTEKHQTQETESLTPTNSKSKRKKKQPKIPEIAKKTEQPINIQELIGAYRHAYFKGKYTEALTKAWQVIKHTDAGSPEYKQAADRIDQLSKLEIPEMPKDKDCSYDPTGKFVFINGSSRNKITIQEFEKRKKKLAEQIKEITQMKPHILYYQTILHKNDADQSQAIAYFMEAQNLKETGKLDQDPQEIDPTTFAALTGKLTSVINTTDEDIQHAVAHISSLADAGNQQAIQAIATYYHKAAHENPATQLLNLRMAFQHLNRLDGHADRLKGFNYRQILFDYFQQLYTFARVDDHASTQGIMDIRNYFFLTRLVAEALIGLNTVSCTPEQEDWKTQARCTLKGNLLKISTHVNKFLAKFDCHDPEKRTDIHTLILDGANGLPLSIGQRKKIIETLRAADPQDPLVTSLAGPYEQSAYYKRSLSEKGKPNVDYYRMLFALDNKDYKTAFTLAQKAVREHNDYRAQMFISNILLYTDVIPRSDDQKLQSIRNIRQDLMHPAKMCMLFPVHADALELAQELAAKNHLPTLEYLIDIHCADHAKRYNPDIYKTLFNQIKESLKTKSRTQGLALLTAQDFYTDFIYMCWLDKCLDPAWDYIDCMVEFIIQCTESKHAQPAAAILKRFAEDVGVNLAIDTPAGTVTESMGHKRLKDKIAQIISEKNLMLHLKSIGCDEAALDLYWSLHPEHAPKKDTFESPINDFAQLFLPPVLVQTQNEPSELALTPKYSKAHKFEILNFMSNEKKEEYRRNPSFQKAQIISDYRKRGDFKLYAQTYGTQAWHEPCAKDRDTYVIDLLVKAAHEYMIAQANAQTELNMLEVPAVNTLIQQAITVDPVCAYMNISYLLQENSLWQRNAPEGYKYLHKASLCAEKSKKKLSPADMMSLNQLKQRYSSIIALSTLANTIQSHANTLSSGKIE